MNKSISRRFGYTVVRLTLSFLLLLLAGCSCSRQHVEKLNYSNPFLPRFQSLNSVMSVREVVAELGKPAAKTVGRNGNFSLVYRWGKMVYERKSSGPSRLRMLLIENTNNYFSIEFNPHWRKKDVRNKYGKEYGETDSGLLYKSAPDSLGGITFTFEKNRLKSILYTNMN